MAKAKLLKPVPSLRSIGELDDEIEHTLTDESQVEEDETPAATEPKKVKGADLPSRSTTPEQSRTLTKEPPQTINPGQSFSPRQIKSRRVWH